jgi:hypothetical protein
MHIKYIEINKQTAFQHNKYRKMQVFPESKRLQTYFNRK